MKLGEQPILKGDFEQTFSGFRSEPYWFMSVSIKPVKKHFPDTMHDPWPFPAVRSPAGSLLKVTGVPFFQSAPRRVISEREKG